MTDIGLCQDYISVISQFHCIVCEFEYMFDSKTGLCVRGHRNDYIKCGACGTVLEFGKCPRKKDGLCELSQGDHLYSEHETKHVYSTNNPNNSLGALLSLSTVPVELNKLITHLQKKGYEVILVKDKINMTIGNINSENYLKTYSIGVTGTQMCYNITNIQNEYWEPAIKYLRLVKLNLSINCAKTYSWFIKQRIVFDVDECTITNNVLEELQIYADLLMPIKSQPYVLDLHK